MLRNSDTEVSYPRVALLLVLGAFLWTGCSLLEDTRPNFIIIFADDLGYGDLGCYGSTQHRTPRLDRMAAEGRKFNSFYVSASVCTPSRAALLTGSYPKRVSLHQNLETKHSVLFPGNKQGLHPDEVTLAEILKEQGYATAAVGKWHLGDQKMFLPTSQGFDSYFGIPFSNDMGEDVFAHADYPALPLMRGEEVIETEPDQAFLTKRYTEEAIQFIKANRDGPFFLYMPHTMVHYPLFASKEFRGQSVNGPYGDATEELDWSVGQILDTLQELEIDENTLVIFTSDNGAAPVFGGGNGPLRGGKATPWEGGQRVPCLMRWPGRIPAGMESDELVTSLDITPTLARLGGGEMPTDRIIDGMDIWPVISGGPEVKSPRDTFYYYQLGNLSAVRWSDWKLHFGRRGPVDGEYRFVPSLELYNLAEDLGETTNVAEQNPEIVARLQEIGSRARADIGDDATGEAGANTRPSGWFEDAKPLTTRSEFADEITKNDRPEEGPFDAFLGRHLTFYSSFDRSPKAAFSLGDPDIYTASSQKQLEEARKGLHNPDIRLSRRGGRFGGNLVFGKRNRHLVYYQGEKNVAYSPHRWGGTVSFWLNLSPEKDLEPGFCDPIQITDTTYNDGALWVDFSGQNPRDFRLGILGDVEIWNPNQLPPNKDPNFERRLIAVSDLPFQKGRWTHVVFTFVGLNGRSGGRGILYLNGQHQGTSELIMEPFTWNTEQASIRLGLNYVGGFDELALFDRALSPEQVTQLYEMKSSLQGIALSRN